jgi:hypothetical protein
MNLRQSPRFQLSPGEQRLLKWLSEQYLNGHGTLTFQRGDECEDERLRQLGMGLGDVETDAKRLEAWGREHWNIDPKCYSGTPPVRVEADENGFRLIIAPQIGEICASYEAWLESQQSKAGGSVANPSRTQCSMPRWNR